MTENAASKFKTFWAKQPRCATTPNPGHRPPKIETSVPHSFSGRVHVVTGSPLASPQVADPHTTANPLIVCIEQRTWARPVDARPNTWARPAETAQGFWGTAPNMNHPTRKVCRQSNLPISSEQRVAARGQSDDHAARQKLHAWVSSRCSDSPCLTVCATAIRGVLLHLLGTQRS